MNLPIRAAINKNLEMIKYLASKGADVSVQDALNVNPIFLFADDGNVEAFKLLIGLENVQGDKVDIKGKNILFRAIKLGDLGTIKLIIEKFPELLPSRDSEECTILHEAIANDNFELFKYFVEECGLDFNEPDSYSYTSLEMAVNCVNYDIVEYLLDT